MSPRHQRWLLKLGQYDFEIEYIKGKENRVADFLSRIENNMENSNKGEEEEKMEEIQCSRNNSILSERNIIYNVEDDDISMVTIHSAEENLLDHFCIKA